MANNYSQDAVDNTGEIWENQNIETNLPRQITRIATIDKALLEREGTILVGTGKWQTVTIGTETYEVPIIIALDPPTGVGSFTLMCTRDAEGIDIDWVPLGEV